MNTICLLILLKLLVPFSKFASKARNGNIIGWLSRQKGLLWIESLTVFLTALMRLSSAYRSSYYSRIVICRLYT